MTKLGNCTLFISIMRLLSNNNNSTLSIFLGLYSKNYKLYNNLILLGSTSKGIGYASKVLKTSFNTIKRNMVLIFSLNNLIKIKIISWLSTSGVKCLIKFLLLILLFVFNGLKSTESSTSTLLQ